MGPCSSLPWLFLLVAIDPGRYWMRALTLERPFLPARSLRVDESTVRRKLASLAFELGARLLDRRAGTSAYGILAGWIPTNTKAPRGKRVPNSARGAPGTQPLSPPPPHTLPTYTALTPPR